MYLRYITIFLQRALEIRTIDFFDFMQLTEMARREPDNACKHKIMARAVTSICHDTVSEPS